MKRKTFEIKVDGVVVGKRYTYNASIRGTEAMIREQAKADDTTYVLIDHGGEKDAFRNHYRGFRVWRGDNGKVIRYDIELVA